MLATKAIASALTRWSAFTSAMSIWMRTIWNAFRATRTVESAVTERGIFAPIASASSTSESNPST